MMLLRVAALVCCAFGLIPAQNTGPWNLDELRKPPKTEWVDGSGSFRSLTYEGEPYHGRPTSVFAYYATPAGSKGPFPGVVLVHGGGGAAFREWAYMWAARGYAALAMDLAGKGANGAPLGNGGPDQGNEPKFDDIRLGVKEAWTYHAIADVIRGISLLAARPEVDRDRIAVTGISWGGYLTSLVVGVDDRIRAAAPVYGCGFIFRNSPWVKNIDGLGPELRQKWIENFDPARYLGAAKAPMLWVTRAQDFHYRMDNYQRSYSLPSGPRTLSITTDRNHSHPAGWSPPEIEIFFNHQLKGGPPLTALEESKIVDGRVQASYAAVVPVVRAELAYTLEDPTSPESKWQTQEGRVEGGSAVAALPEPRPRAFFLIVTDERGARVSNPCIGCDDSVQ